MVVMFVCVYVKSAQTQAVIYCEEVTSERSLSPPGTGHQHDGG